MQKFTLLKYIKQLNHPVFTTGDLSGISGKSLSTTTQRLNFLCRQGVVLKIYRGIWAEITDKPISPYSIIPYLLPLHRVYVSFTTALHLHGIIEQIPQVITLASTAHTKIIHTKTGVFSIHQISPALFDGFDWYNHTGEFLIAEPEKALFDCLYLSVYKKNQFGYFPELHFTKKFSFNKVNKWIEHINDIRTKKLIKTKLQSIKKVLV